MKTIWIIAIILLLVSVLVFILPIIKNNNPNQDNLLKNKPNFQKKSMKEQVNNKEIDSKTKIIPLIDQKEVKIKNLQPNNIPKIIHTDFIELDKISKISKFRSGVGHDFSRGVNETNSCRSMKHYFEPNGVNDSFYHTKTSKKDWPIIKYFAPVSGIIIDMRPSTNMFGDEEQQFLLQSKENPQIVFSFFHVITKNSLQTGKTVEAGEFLGTISPGNSGEIAVSINFGSENEQLVSYFELIDDSVFNKYKERGVNSINDLIITKQQRELNPLICDKEFPHRFIGSNEISTNKKEYDSWANSQDNWFFLK